jgi:hypothetical protein
MILTVGPLPLNAWAKVPIIMIISSMPSEDGVGEKRMTKLKRQVAGLLTHALTPDDVSEPTE